MASEGKLAPTAAFFKVDKLKNLRGTSAKKIHAIRIPHAS